MRFNLFSLAVFLFALPVSSQQYFKGYEHLFSSPLQYTISKTNTAPVIDGSVNEDEWTAAPWSEHFTDIEGKAKPTPRFNTRFRLLWDESYLYIAAELIEPDIWSTLTKHDTIVFLDNDFEVFIDPDNDTHHYFEIEINASGTILDLYMSKPYRNRGKLKMDWNAAGLQKAIFIDGSLNDNTDVDKRWTVEMAIPFTSLQQDSIITDKPTNGTVWRLNFSRVQWEMDKKGKGYEKKTNPETKKSLPENNWVWSPQGVINMHFPERWGYARFSNDAKPQHSENFVPAIETEARNLLWLIYYKQVDYRKANKRFAPTLKEIGLPEVVVFSDKQEAKVSLTILTDTYTATLLHPLGKWEIFSDSKIIKVN